MGGSLGNKPCGRVLLGPFSWVHMGEFGNFPALNTALR